MHPNDFALHLERLKAPTPIEDRIALNRFQRQPKHSRRIDGDLDLPLDDGAVERGYRSLKLLYE